MMQFIFFFAKRKLASINWLVMVLLAFSSCNKSTDQNNTSPQNLWAEVESFPIRFNEPYVINQITGDSITDPVNASGAITSSAAVDIDQKIVPAKKARNPKRKRAIQPKQVRASFNEKIYSEPKRSNINTDGIKIVPLGKGKDYELLNSSGTTLITGMEIPASGTTTNKKQPNITRAKDADYKENAVNNIQIYNVQHGLASSYIYSILEDHNGHIWFGTEGNGVCRYDGVNFMRYTTENGLNDNQVVDIVNDREGNIWFGTLNGGVCKFDGINFVHFTENEGLPSNKISSLLADDQGNIWIGSYKKGITKFDGESFIHFTTKQGLSSNKIQDLLQDHKGNIYIATDGGGLSVFDGSTFTQYSKNAGLKSDQLQCLYQDHKNNIWVGYGKHGATRISENYLTHYSTENGLFSNKVRAITGDTDDNIWFGTRGGGISKLDNDFFKSPPA